MQRREFLKTSSTLLAGATLAPTAIAATKAASPANRKTAPGRLILPILRNWRFSTTVTGAAHAPGYDDSAFESVVIPHTNLRLPWHSFDDRSYEFVSLYRRRFKLPAEAQGKRVFVDFEGVMTASTVWINGHKLGEYKGGFTPFSFELTPHIDYSGENVLAVDVDSTERADIPPFGYEIDYLTFGGIYREVALRIVNDLSLENIHVRTINVLTAPGLEIDCYFSRAASSKPGKLELKAELTYGDGDSTVQSITDKLPAPAVSPAINPGDAGQAQGAKPYAESDKPGHTLKFGELKGIELWDLDHPHLYTVKVQLLEDGVVIDELTRRIGFREATFTDRGFSLNGKIIKLRGLDRHQTFAYVGQAMPARMQRHDARILKQELHTNIVRTSHYPQSRHFLDACDEMGLLVLEEIPGWQHIGPLPWQDVAVDNVGRMIRRDWNHPSIILWGVRINESRDNHDFYTRTNALAHTLDSTRQTGGIRYFQESEFLEDVFTMNDFGFPLKKPNHPRYLNTEFVGHTFPTKTTDDDERQREHTLRHARIHNQLASDPQYAGGIGWCAFDYNTHANFGAGDRICYHGVTDIFRLPKAAAGFYKSQCDPATEIVLEPAFHWANSDESVGFSNAVICSNCDHIKVYLAPYEHSGGSGIGPAINHSDIGAETLIAELDPDHTTFEHLTYPPFQLNLEKYKKGWGDLRIEGFLKGKSVISRTYSGRGSDQKFALIADDTTLLADGADTTRIVLRVTDEYDAIRTYANDPIAFTLSGPAELIGDNPFALIGGTGALYLRSQLAPGTVELTATHPRLGKQSLTFTLTATPPELA